MRNLDVSKFASELLERCEYSSKGAKVELLKAMDANDELYRIVMRGFQERVAQEIVDKAIKQHNAKFARESAAPADDSRRIRAIDTVPMRSRLVAARKTMFSTYISDMNKKT